MLGFLIFIHILVCILLATVVLMQAGRGGGLTEQFASAESMFGAKTNVFMVKLTGIFATLFLLSSLTLAFLSAKKDRSLMTQVQQKADAFNKQNQESKPALPGSSSTSVVPSAVNPSTQNAGVQSTKPATTQNSAETHAVNSKDVQPTPQTPAAAKPAPAQ